MTSRGRSVSLALTVTAFIAFVFLVGARPVRAQPPSPAASASQGQPEQQPPAASPTDPAAQPPAADDDEKLDQSEPDYSVINLPSTLRLPAHKGDFHLVHRFGENLRADDFSTQAQNLFGIDQGATIGLEFRFGLMKHLEGIVLRTNNGRTIQFSAKYDGWHQSASLPLSVSAIVSAEGTNNFGACSNCGDTAHAQAIGAVLSREFGENGTVYLEPFWVHGTGGVTVPGQSTGFVGIGARGRVHGTTYLVFEVSPRLGGFILADGSPEYAFAIEKRVGGHVFQLQFGNSAAMTYGQIAKGGNPGGLYFGFNLSRKFF